MFSNSVKTDKKHHRYTIRTRQSLKKEVPYDSTELESFGTSPTRDKRKCCEQCGNSFVNLMVT